MKSFVEITNMRKIILKLIVILFFANGIQAQGKKVISADELLKESIYNLNKKTVMNYSIKEFDALFFEFFNKKREPSLILTKEKFYTYTVKIAIFSDRLAKLYPKEKDVAEANKKEWMSESYEDYLLSKETPKK
jgi:hypothetical protein